MILTVTNPKQTCPFSIYVADLDDSFLQTLYHALVIDPLDFPWLHSDYGDLLAYYRLEDGYLVEYQYQGIHPVKSGHWRFVDE